MPNKKNYQPKKDRDALQVSFLPQEITDESKTITRHKKILVLILTSAVVIPFLIWIFLLIRINSIKSDIKAVETDIIETEKNSKAKVAEFEEVRALSNRIAPAKTILQKHTFWSNFFKSLEENTLADIVYNNLALDEKSVILTGIAKNYEIIARQMVSFKNAPFIKDIKVSGLAAQTSPKGEMIGVNFSFSVILNQDIFKPSL